MHVPVQAASQQSPSGAQNPLPHSPLAAQAAPFARLTWQVPPTQAVPSGQSAFSVHGMAHPSPLHAYAPQSTRAPAVQSPAPSQIPAEANVCGSRQAAGAHSRPSGAARHAPRPSHAPSCPQASPAVSSAQSSCGSMPAMTGAHAPSSAPV
jgi:hypothetical protein